MSKFIEVKARVDKQLFYNENSMFGIYSFYPIEASEEIKLNEIFGNFVVKGNCPMLKEGKEYEFIMEPIWNKKYGDGYQFVEIKSPKLDSIEGQQEYLYLVLSKNDADTLINAHPNERILDLIKNDQVDVNKLNGIKEKRLAKIKERLLAYETISVALVELKELGATINSIQRLINHFGSQELLIQKVSENIYSLCEVESFGFKKVDEYAMRRGDDPFSKNRIIACFEYLIKKNEGDGHTWIHKEQLLEQANDLLKIGIEPIINVFNSLTKNDDHRIYIQNEMISFKKSYNYENKIKYHLDRLMKTYEKPENVLSIDELEKKLNTQFTDEQKEAIQLAQEHGVFILNGRAGSGKTYTVKGIVESLGHDYYTACALSGKAANVLSSRGIQSSTIHRLLKVDMHGRFVHNRNNPLFYKTIILDEASMVNSYLFYSLLEAIPDGSQFIIVGDNGQLPPIGVGAVFDDLLKANIYPQKELTKVHRQAEKSGILTVANLIRDGQKINGRYEYGNKYFGENNDMLLIPTGDREQLYSHTIEIAKGYVDKYGKEASEHFQILTPLKRRGKTSVKNLNNELQGIFNDLEKTYIEKNGYQFREGDKVIHTGNNYSAFTVKSVEEYLKYKHLIDNIIDEDELEEYTDLEFWHSSVFNGTFGKILYLDPEKEEVFIQFEDVDGVVVYSKEELNNIELGYAITVHKSQGVGVKNVLFVLDYTAYKLLSKQLIYTGVTRASEKLVLLCENGALHKAIETDLGNSRNTFLYGLLRKGGNTG